LALVKSVPTPSGHNVEKWIAYVGIAASFFLAASGVCIRQLGDVPAFWLVFSWLAVFFWLFLLIRLHAFSKPNRILFLLGSVIGLNLLAQSTGGEQSPLIFGVFILMGIAAWEGEAKYGFWVASFFSLLEFLYLRKEDAPQGLSLYLRWGAYLVSAFFLARVVKTRKEKERLDHRLESLRNDAVQLATEAEPSSFNVPKDKLLMEESRLSARVGTVMELEETLIRQLSLFQKSLSLHTAVFFLLTTIQEKKVLRLRAFSSLSDSIASDVTLQPGETLIGLSAKEGRRVLLNDIAAESARALPYYLKPGLIGSFLAQPIYLKNSHPETNAVDEQELVGVIALDHEKPGFFNERELALIERFGTMLADTIQNARVMHFSRTKTRNLHALYEVSNSFSTLLDLNKVLETALKTATEISACDSAYVALAEGDGRKFVVRAWWGPTRTNEQPLQLEDELAAWVLENKKAIRYTRGLKDKGLGSFSKKEGMLGSIQSFLMVPFLVGENVLGVIRLNSTKPDAYQAYDQDILKTLANQTAMALENALMVQQIRDMAIRDGLTGAYNHRYFQEKLGEEIAKAERYNKDLSLALLDVDHFKKFNDSYGHQEGDKVLRIVSEVIQATVRNKIDTFARYGGEEFAIILPESDGNMAKDLAERIRKNVESYLFENNGKSLYRVTVSIGVSSYPFDARDQKSLIQLSDQALYEAKKDGRNAVRRFKTLEKPV
jgi:diguanylate cyclase (GGDEF)-like protein